MERGPKNEFQSDSSKGRVIKNGVFIGLRFLVYTLTGVFFIPFLVRQYGRGTYGLIALAGFLTQYVGLISSCVGNAVARFLNIALNRNDWRQANEIFSTAIIANLAFICIQIPVFALGVWKLDWLISFPAAVGTDFRILVVCNIAVFFVNIIKGVVFSPIQAANRLDIGEQFEIARQLIQLVLLVAFIYLYGARLWIIGAVDLFLSVLTGLLGFQVFRRLSLQQLHFRREFMTMKWVRPVLGMAGWSMVSVFGYSLFVKTDVLIINRLVDEDMAGVYAALLVVPNFVRQIGSQLAALVGPIYMIDYAKDNLPRMMAICLFSSKLLAYFAAAAVGFVCVFADDILLQWLGADYVQYALLLQLMSISLVLTLSETAMWGIFPAINKMHYTAWANLVPGVLNIVLSIALVFAGYGAVGVAVGTIVSSILKCSVILPLGLSKELDSSYVRFLAIYAKSTALFLLVVLAGVAAQWLAHGRLAESLLLFSAGMLALAPVALFLGFSRAERGHFLPMLVHRP